MAYTTDTNTKIVTFLNKAQAKMGEVSTFVSKRLGKRVELYKDELDTAYLLDSFVRSLDNNFNDWTEQEIINCIDFWNARANLSNTPYFEHSTYNVKISYSKYLGQYMASSNIDMNGFKVVNLANGTNANDAVNKSQLDTKVSKSGDTMSGDLNLNGHKITNLPASSANGEAVRHEQIVAEIAARTSADNTLQTNITTEASTRASADTTLQDNITAEASTRSSADITLQTNITTEASTRSSADTTLQTNINGKVSKSGDTMSGALAMGTNKITGLANATNADEAVNKSQLDAVADESTISWQTPAAAGITLSSGWSSTSPAFQVRIVRGVIYFRGVIQKGTTPNSGDSVMTLPVGYRPLRPYAMIAISDLVTSNFLVMNFGTSGVVSRFEFGTTTGSPTTTNSVSFDNIQFDISH